MAKYQVKNKDKKPVVVIHPNQSGKIGDIPVTVAHNKASGRYSFKIDGKLNLSDSHQGCMFRAKQHEVVWDKND